MNGEGVKKDCWEGVYNLEEASIGSHVHATYQLGVHEYNTGRYERHDDSMDVLMKWYQEGHVKEEDLTRTLRAHNCSRCNQKYAVRY